MRKVKSTKSGQAVPYLQNTDVLDIFIQAVEFMASWREALSPGCHELCGFLSNLNAFR